MSTEDEVKAHKIFASAEKPVRDWISEYLGADDLFGPGFDEAEPIMFQLEDDRYLELKLQKVDAEYVHNIEFLEKKEVRDAIEFLAYAVNVVFMTTLKSMDKNPAYSILLAWDPHGLMYVPTCSPPKLREYQLCMHMLATLKKTDPDWVAKYKEINDKMSGLKEEVEQLSDEIAARNEELQKISRISIVARVLSKEELPELIHTRHLKPVADVRYADPQ
jgi:hypothetical protein